MVVKRERTPRALTIAGSDSGGGAGIQADLKAFARCGVHGTCALTAITAQNTIGVTAVHEVPPQMILAQVRAVAQDIGVDAVKVGMVGTAQAAVAVAEALDQLPGGTPVVVDPVMVAESGATLLSEDARSVLVREVLPRASVITPNLPEARALIEVATGAAGPREPAELARALLALGAEVVVITGGHRREATDIYCDASAVTAIAGVCHPSGSAHGSGCTHSSVLAAQLALGCTPLQAARTARDLAGEAVRDGLEDLGCGPGPVDVVGLARRRRQAP